MNIEKKIWYDLVQTKFGDEYLIIYLSKQKNFRKIFKIVTIVFSAGGVFSAFQSFKIPTIISCAVIGLIQIFTSIENFVIHSEDDLDSLSNLRLKYYDRFIKLEILWHSIRTKKISEDEAANEFFNLRNSAKEIEELDNKLNVRKYKGLIKVANTLTLNYLNTYYNE